MAPAPNDEFKLSDSIISYTLRHVPFEGWTLAALEHGAKDAGIDRDTAYRLFDYDVSKLITCYSEMLDRKMLAQVEEINFTQMRVRDRIATCVMTRLNLMAPHREAANKAAIFLSLPTHATLSAKLLSKTVNAMWHAAGDSSTDFNYYSKRGLLAAVYTATLLYWFNDTSIDFSDTKRFLDRRIENTMAIPKVKQALKSVAEFATTMFRK